MSEASAAATPVVLPGALADEVEQYALRHGLSDAESLVYLIMAGLRAEAVAMRQARCDQESPADDRSVSLTDSQPQPSSYGSA
jgi:hypothetical protein